MDGNLNEILQLFYCNLTKQFWKRPLTAEPLTLLPLTAEPLAVELYCCQILHFAGKFPLKILFTFLLLILFIYQPEKVTIQNIYNFKLIMMLLACQFNIHIQWMFEKHIYTLFYKKMLHNIKYFYVWIKAINYHQHIVRLIRTQ